MEDLVKLTSSWSGMCEEFFKEPTGRNTVLDPVQRRVFNVMEYGDDISIFPLHRIRKHYYVLMCWPRQFGKTYTIAKLSSVAATLYPNFHIGCYGPHDKRAKILLKKIKDDLKYSAYWDLVNKKVKSKEHLELDNESTVDSFNTSELQIRGDTEDLQLIDEADYIYDNDLILDSIEPKTLIPRNNGWGKILMISTPNMRNDESVFKTWYADAVNSRKLYCRSCDTLHDIHSFLSPTCTEDLFTIFEIPETIDNCSCGSRAFVYYYDSEKMVIPVDPKNNPRISWALLKRRLDERHWSPKARQEYLGEIIFGGGSMFTLDVMVRMETNRLKNKDYPPEDWEADEHLVCAGLDYGKTHDNTVLTFVEKKEHEYDLLHMYVLDSENYHPSWSQIRAEIKRKLMAWNPTFLCADCTGLGNESVERMTDDLEKWDLDTILLSNRKNHTGYYMDRKGKNDLVTNLEEKIKSRQVYIPTVTEPEMREMRSEFLNFGYEVTKASNVIYQALRGKDDRVISLGLALIGFDQDAFPEMLEYVWTFQ